MFSYVFMKVLESRASRYDLGINILTAGHAGRVKKQIVDRWVKPDMEVLDIGCGTGELMAHAARRGATVTGIDISETMLSVAGKRFKEGALGEKTRLYHGAVTELDRLLKGKQFDLITSTLVFSELYPEERRWAYREIAGRLKGSGVLVLASEVRPKGLLKRLIHTLIRFPLSMATYLITQTGTTAIKDMAEEVTRAGLEVLGEERSLLGSFSILWALKGQGAGRVTGETDRTMAGEKDTSVLKTVWDYIGRWFPSPVEPGLRKIGEPGRDAPVFVTGNFHLTVRRVEKALAGMDAWLLVAPTKGINVWCAACGGELNTQSLFRILKTSGISDRVSHRRLILPQFAAPGVDIHKLKRETGFHAVFGPAYAKDIPAYLREGRKNRDMRLARYPMAFRLEMLLSMNLLIWALAAVFLLLINPAWLLGFSMLFWGAGILLYAGYPWLPGNSGWVKGLALGLLIILGIALETFFLQNKDGYAHWGWMVTALIVCFWLGFDLRGIVAGNTSEATGLLETFGIHSIGKLYSSRCKTRGIISRDMALCTHCRTCEGVCPKGVFEWVDKRNGVAMASPGACFRCGACVFQCPEKALKIS